MWQPWAWAVVHGPKGIENRIWLADLLGDIWVHATGKTPRIQYERGRETILRLTSGELEVPALGELDQGAMLGRARVVDVILPGGWSPHGSASKTCSLARGHFKLHGPDWGAEPKFSLARSPYAGTPWHFVDQYGYVLEERRALAEPVRCNGHQRWWTLPRELVERVLAVQLGEARRAA